MDSSDPFGQSKPKVRDPERPLKYNPTGAYDRIPDDLRREMMASGVRVSNDGSPLNSTEGGDYGEQQTIILVPCPTCGRKFREDRLEKHSSACRALTDGASRRGHFTATPNSSLSGLGASYSGGGFNSSTKSNASSASASSPMRSSTTSTTTKAVPSASSASRSPAPMTRHYAGGTTATTAHHTTTAAQRLPAVSSGTAGRPTHLSSHTAHCASTRSSGAVSPSTTPTSSATAGRTTASTTTTSAAPRRTSVADGIPRFGTGR